MPHFKIETNIPTDKIPGDFAVRTTKIISKALGKPESYCVCSITGGIQMGWGGDSAPCAIATLMSIGQLGTEQNKKHAKVLYQHVEKELGIPPTKMYITFQDVKPADLGFNGSTFHDILG